MDHNRGAPYHPMTQGKIKRYHESIKNVIPADVFFNRHHEVLDKRKILKIETMKQRRKYNLNYNKKTSLEY